MDFDAVVVGLGNPGKEYKGTRHNIGADFVEQLANEEGLDFKKDKYLNAKLCAGEFAGKFVLFVLPEVFMNESGKVLAVLARKIPALNDKLVLVHDELHLLFAELKISCKKSAGGHNGVESVVSAIGSKTFCRIRLGIGKEKGKAPQNMKKFVLEKFNSAEREQTAEFYDKFKSALYLLLKEGEDKASNKFNV